MKLINPRFVSDVFKDDGRAFDEAAGGDGPVLGIEYRGMGRAQQ